MIQYFNELHSELLVRRLPAAWGKLLVVVIIGIVINIIWCLHKTDFLLFGAIASATTRAQLDPILCVVIFKHGPARLIRRDKMFEPLWHAPARPLLPQ